MQTSIKNTPPEIYCLDSREVFLNQAESTAHVPEWLSPFLCQVVQGSLSLASCALISLGLKGLQIQLADRGTGTTEGKSTPYCL